VPNGNYDVTVQLGDPAAASSEFVYSELRRIVVPTASTTAGLYALQTFTVNVRQEVHDGYGAVGGVLNLLVGGTAPRLHGVGVAPAPNAITIFVAGDSTVCDWDPNAPNAPGGPIAAVSGWAQELSAYLKRGVAVANFADSGETAASDYTKFFGPARTAMKAGDYLFIQFGHNDQKLPADIANYQTNLMRYVTDARAKNATPVIFTPVSREGGAVFQGLDQQARDLAAAQNVALIDLTNLSLNYYRSLPDRGASLFIDGTHFHEAGALQIANLVAQALKASSLPLATLVK
jgi:lysophospholipase L1-like esterase